MHLLHSLLLYEFVATVDNLLECIFDLTAISHTKYACNDSEEEKLPFNTKRLPAELEIGSVKVTICHDRLGVWENKKQIEKLSMLMKSQKLMAREREWLIVGSTILVDVLQEGTTSKQNTRPDGASKNTKRIHKTKS